LIVIVVGVLIALALNSWWANLQDRKRERVLLLEFREEFVENKRLLDIQSGVWRRRKDAAQTLFGLGSGAARGELSDVAQVEHQFWTLIHRDFLPWVRTVTALPDSGYGSIGFEPGHFETDSPALHLTVVLENYLREYIALSRVLDIQRRPLEKTMTDILEKIEEHLEHG
jgi:hypothetical protein